MQAPVFYPTHFFEGCILTVTGQATGFESYYLNDRDVAALWMDSAFSGTRTVTGHWTSTGTPPDVERLIIPAGHGLAGTTLTVQSAPEPGSSWSTRGTITPLTNDDVVLPMSAGAFNAPWWRVQIAGATAAPYAAEFYLTAGVAMERGSNYDGGNDGAISGITRRVSIGGTVRKSRQWGPRWYGEYTIPGITEDNWSAWITTVFPVLDHTFCYMVDDYGVLRFVELLDAQQTAAFVPILRRTPRLRLQAVA